MNRSKAIQGMYTTDGAGQEFLTAETEDLVAERLAAQGIDPSNMDADSYDRMFDEELIAMQSDAEDDYGSYLADQAESAAEDREYWANIPGGEADYTYG